MTDNQRFYASPGEFQQAIMDSGYALSTREFDIALHFWYRGQVDAYLMGKLSQKQITSPHEIELTPLYPMQADHTAQSEVEDERRGLQGPPGVPAQGPFLLEELPLSPEEWKDWWQKRLFTEAPKDNPCEEGWIAPEYPKED